MLVAMSQGRSNNDAVIDIGDSRIEMQDLSLTDPSLAQLQDAATAESDRPQSSEQIPQKSRLFQKGRPPPPEQRSANVHSARTPAGLSAASRIRQQQ